MLVIPHLIGRVDQSQSLFFVGTLPLLQQGIVDDRASVIHFRKGSVFDAFIVINIADVNGDDA